MNNEKIVESFPLDQESAAEAMPGESPELAAKRALQEAMVALQKSGSFKKYVALFLRPQLEEEVAGVRTNSKPGGDPVRAAWHEGRAQLLEGILDIKAAAEFLGAEVAAHSKPKEETKK